MSDLARSFVASKLASLPPEPPLPEDKEEREDDSSSASSMSSTGTVIPSGSLKPAAPIQWSDFFAQELYLELEKDGEVAKFHVYHTPSTDPRAPLVVLHHGAGSSALSFALFTLELQRLLPKAGILAVEAREHGSVVHDASGAVQKDLSIQTLSDDLVEMIQLTQARLNWPTLPEIWLVGHSLGGAVVTHTAKTGQLGNKLMGYAVLDVVEGSAMETIKHMQSYLSSRPSIFPTISSAVDWHIRSRTLRNPESARVSVPSLLMQTSTGRWTWRTDLTGTQTYWENWFVGMSRKFLSARGAKLLLLAGTDRLDKELMIGQMQGKFQLQVFPAAGHFIQEDLPEKTAEVIVEFIKRNDRSTLVLPPKVSDLLAQGKKV
ncbi:protein phosphatase methylesteras-like protein 1 [Eremomyces bilateralis CBS 781.70]|uniref:Protein phosphatase methylesterase 1 n=1 Tax=Eremomyces bilateralis CBS 781.70 TaxID=1392243 RepID=A0A6G1FVB3_9PEZI|nr:protein phosphatase methylesteras-like protein 1 [Eremomyces bilateralis CBS 781.70]KAF1809670.1 protein phosphatase methylesteras-like protein 1 [Eremomyces bilateralis CBS 781.70]